MKSKRLEGSQCPLFGPSGPKVERDWIARLGHSVAMCQTVSRVSPHNLQFARCIGSSPLLYEW